MAWRIAATRGRSLDHHPNRPPETIAEEALATWRARFRP
jgi:hypothetical protein